MPLLLGKGLGCKKDPVDDRDFPLTRLSAAKRKKLPVRVDHTKRMSRVSDQGKEGTCVGFATVDGMKEYQEKKEWKRNIQLSVRYVYDNAKKLDGSPHEEGTTIRVAMKVLEKKGVPSNKCWPYRPYHTNRPCKSANKLAAKYRISRYVRLKNIQEMKESLHTNGPFVAGVLVFRSWSGAGPDGAVPMPRPGENFAGGHAICIVGYDDKSKMFRFKNSWGKKWGDEGYGYLSYGYMKEYLLDAWSGKDVLHRPKKRKGRKKKKKRAKKKDAGKKKQKGKRAKKKGASKKKKKRKRAKKKGASKKGRKKSGRKTKRKAMSSNRR